MSNRGIEIDLDKIKALQATLVLEIQKEMRSFLGHLSYIVLHFLIDNYLWVNLLVTLEKEPRGIGRRQ